MTTPLKGYEQFKDYEVKMTDAEQTLLLAPILDVLGFDMYNYRFKFPNGYGASVVKHFGSYGYEEDLFEVAVLEFEDNGEFSICYSTPITDDVIGHLTNDEVLSVLEEIRRL